MTAAGGRVIGGVDGALQLEPVRGDGLEIEGPARPPVGGPPNDQRALPVDSGTLWPTDVRDMICHVPRHQRADVGEM